MTGVFSAVGGGGVGARREMRPPSVTLPPSEILTEATETLANGMYFVDAVAFE